MLKNFDLKIKKTQVMQKKHEFQYFKFYNWYILKKNIDISKYLASILLLYTASIQQIFTCPHSTTEITQCT